MFFGSSDAFLLLGALIAPLVSPGTRCECSVDLVVLVVPSLFFLENVGDVRRAGVLFPWLPML